MVRKIIDDCELRRLLKQGVSYAEIARRFGVNINTITLARKRLGLIANKPSKKPSSKARKSPKISLTPPPPAAEEKVPDVPGLDARRVSQLIRTNGVYREIARLAEEVGEPEQKLICQWHRVRAMT